MKEFLNILSVGDKIGCNNFYQIILKMLFMMSLYFSVYEQYNT